DRHLSQREGPRSAVPRCVRGPAGPAWHRPLRECAVASAAFDAVAANTLSVTRPVAAEDPRAPGPIRLRRVPAPHEGHWLSRRIGPRLWRARHHTELEYDRGDREGAGSQSLIRIRSSARRSRRASVLTQDVSGLSE